MTVKLDKIKLIPISSVNVEDYLLDLLSEELKDVIDIIDKYGAVYEHENPWLNAYFNDPMFYLYRVKIGAIGRINCCKDALRLGLIPRVYSNSNSFTSMGLYHLFRIARQTLSKFLHTKNLQNWLNSLIRNKNDYSRYLNYYNIESMAEDEKETEES